MDFHCYLVGSQTVMLGNGSEEDVLGVGTYKLSLHGGNTLILHNATQASGVRVCLLSLVSLMRLGFFFNSHTDGLDILYDGNVFGLVTLENNFFIVDLDDCYNNNNTSSAFVSHFDSNSDFIKWHARLEHIG